MSLRFLCDQCVPAEIGEMLRRQGHEVIRLRDVLPVSAPDLEVIKKAQELGSILVSLNGDFSDIVTYPPKKYQGVVAIQLHNHPETIPQLMDYLIKFLTANPEKEFYHGKLLVVEAHRMRIRQ